MKKMSIRTQLFFQFLLPLLSLSLHFHFSKGSDTLFPGQSLSGKQIISSPGGIFALGFFTPGNSQNYYIGIWYYNKPNQTVVWVANRIQPVSNSSSSSLKLLEDGNLVLRDELNTTIWSSKATSKVPNSTIALLLDNGNFVVRDANDSSNVVWQSFDHPTDHWLPGGKIGYRNNINLGPILTPWRSPENPAPGPFSLEVDPNGTSHVLLWNGSKMYWTSGEWTGKIFSAVPEIQLNFYITNLTYISNKKERYFTYAAANPASLTRFMIDVTGQLKQFVWGKNFRVWSQFWTRPGQQCEVYAFCGAFSSCNQQIEHLCDCLKGFEPKTAKDWGLQDHSDGCVRRTPLQCNNGGEDVFFVMSNTQFPDNSESLALPSVEECKSACLSNCSCIAFAYDNGCLIWKGDLFNLQQLPSNGNIGKDFHLRVAASEPLGTRHRAKRNTTLIVVVAASVSGFFILFGLVLAALWRRRPPSSGVLEAGEDSLVLFTYKDLRSATKSFTEKLGEGGFGSVFKGILPNSTAIAVKTLKSLKQGEKQFRTEVRTIGTIQHINLVRLFGFCAEGSYRFLVYDYMPNGSLESALFQQNTKVLDWKTRYNIAVGTARGLAYLHDKCRDCIIHCDIKPENILLDSEYNPKVADFGLAKLLGRELSRVLTTMRGTRGYLAPEWISGEAITPKADVFSFGMVLLEIISGRRNSGKLDGGFNDYFPTQIANAIDKGEDVVTLLDSRLEGEADKEELTRACRVACWCIQDDEKDRPSMGQVVQILEGVAEVVVPPVPRFLQRLAENSSESTAYQEISSS